MIIPQNPPISKFMTKHHPQFFDFIDINIYRTYKLNEKKFYKYLKINYIITKKITFLSFLFGN